MYIYFLIGLSLRRCLFWISFLLCMWCAVSSFFIASFLCNVQTPNQPTPKGPTQTRGKKKSMSMCQAYQWNLVVLLINNDVSFFSLWLLLIGWALWGLIIVLDNKKWPVFGTIHIYLCYLFSLFFSSSF